MDQNKMLDQKTPIERVEEKLPPTSENEMRLLHMLRENRKLLKKLDEKIVDKNLLINRLIIAGQLNDRYEDSEKQQTQKRTMTRVPQYGYKIKRYDHIEISEDVLLRQKEIIDELHRHSHHWKSVADLRTHELQAIYKSEIWFITWPVRKLFQFSSWIVRHLIKVLRWVLIKTAGVIMRNNKIKTFFQIMLQKCKWLYNFLKNQVVVHGVNAELLIGIDSNQQKNPIISSMTPKAKHIYVDLKYAIEKRRINDIE